MSDYASSIIPLPPGAQLAQYKLLRAVAAGGMGVVYRAKDIELDRDAAVKVLKFEALAAAGNDPEMLRQRFVREARSAAKLNHPNVAAVYQVGRHGDGASAVVFIAMEWLEGGSLWDHLKHSVILDWREATAAIRDAASGLQAAHAAGIIHRDIKPSNLMRTVAGAVKLVDFGLARELEAISELTQAGHVLGTPTYLSPEQCRGEPATPLSDIYSLGCTYFHLLASRPPFEAPNIPGLMHQQVHEPLPDIRRFADDVPPAVAAILERACAKSPADRFQSAGEMAEALSAALAGVAVGGSAFPATVKVATLVDPPNNLPGETSSFIGREIELADVTGSLSASRLTTLLGAGGTGKTRLAIQTARRVMRAFPDGVWLIELAAIADDAPAATIAQSAASALGLKESSGRSFQEALSDHLRDRAALVVLDNCEHVVDAAASVAAALLEDCPKLRILATSRVPLRVPGEAEIRVPSLPTPDADDLPPAELQKLPSARLFAERARAARPGFAITADNAPAVAQICRRLDGIPLAIELAAARAKVLSAQQIAERLGDAFKLLTGGARTLLPRQQTLRALIDWSYDLLDDRARLALARCGVFSGGWTVESAEAVLPAESRAASPDAVPASIHRDDVLDLLTELVEHSLVIADERDGVVRYRMLETIRQYAIEKLAQLDDPVAARHQHARYFVDVVVAASPKMHGATQTATLALLRADHDNLRAALDHAIQHRLLPEAVRLGAILAKFWNIEGQLGDGVRKVTAILKLDPPADLDLARLLDFGGVLAMYIGEPQLTREWFDRALGLAEAGGDRALIGSALNNLSTLAKEQGELQRAYDLSRQALDHRLAVGDPLMIAGSYNNTSNIARAMGRVDEARDLMRKSMRIVTESGDMRWTAYSHLNLGELEIEQGNADVALPLYQRCREILVELDEEWGIAYADDGIGRCLMAKGDLAGARTYLERSLAVCRKFGDKAMIADQLDLLARIALKEGDAGSAMSLATEAATLQLKLNDRSGIASSLETRAAIVAKTDPIKAAELLGCANHERTSRGISASASAKQQVEALTSALRERLGDAFAAAFSAGTKASGTELLTK